MFIFKDLNTFSQCPRNRRNEKVHSEKCKNTSKYILNILSGPATIPKKRQSYSSLINGPLRSFMPNKKQVSLHIHLKRYGVTVYAIENVVS